MPDRKEKIIIKSERPNTEKESEEFKLREK